MKYKKSELTYFAKESSKCAETFLNAAIMSEDLAHDEFGRKIVHWNDEELINEIAKRFAKYTKTRFAPDLNGGAVQDACKIIEKLVYCCEENDWFGYED